MFVHDNIPNTGQSRHKHNLYKKLGISVSLANFDTMVLPDNATLSPICNELLIADVHDKVPIQLLPNSF